jgi:hypothetical protein
MRRAAKRDTTERAIVDALRQAGCLVLQLDAFDLLVFRRGQFFMFDAKTGQGPGDVGPRAVNRGPGWPLCYVRSVSEALALVGAKC